MITHMNNIQAKGFWLGTISGPTINFSVPGFYVNLFRFNFGSSSLSIIGITDLGRFETKLSIPLAKWSWSLFLGMNFQATSGFECFSTSFAVPEIAKKIILETQFSSIFRYGRTVWKIQAFCITMILRQINFLS